MFRRPSGRPKKKNEKLVATVNKNYGKESIQWTNTKIQHSNTFTKFLDGTASPTSTDTPKFIRSLIITSLSIGKSVRGTLWRWNLSRSSPKQILSILTNGRKDHTRHIPIRPYHNLPTLSELDEVGFPSLSTASTTYLTKWMAFERSGASDLLSFIGIETAQKILEDAWTAKDSDALLGVSKSLQGALILGALITTKREEMLLSMALSLWTLLHVAHSQMHDIGFEKKRLWSLLNGLGEYDNLSSTLSKLIIFLELTLPGNMKKENRQSLLSNLEDVLVARRGRVNDKENMMDTTKELEDVEEGLEGGEVRQTFVRAINSDKTPMTSNRQTRRSIPTMETRSTVKKKEEEKINKRVLRSASKIIAREENDSKNMSRRESKRRSKNTVNQEAKKQEKKIMDVSFPNEIGEDASETKIETRSISPPILEPISPEKLRDELSVLSSPEVDYFSPRAEDPPRREGNREKVKKGRRRRSDNRKKSTNECEDGSSLGWISNGDEQPYHSRKRRISEASIPKTEMDGSMPKRRRGRPPLKRTGNDEILGMFHELKMKSEKEWDRDMNPASIPLHIDMSYVHHELADGWGVDTSLSTRPMREKKPVKFYDPTPTTPKKRSSSRINNGPCDDLDMITSPKIPEKDPILAQVLLSEDEMYEERTEADDPDYEIVDRRRRGSREDRMDGNDGMVLVYGDCDCPPYSNELNVDVRLRTIRNKIPIWNELPFQMLPLINVDGVIGLGERTDEAVEGMMEDERRMEGMDEDEFGEEVYHYTGPLDEHSYARSIDDEIVDVVSMEEREEEEEEEIALGLIGNLFKMDEDVEEIHEIIGEDEDEEVVIQPFIHSNGNCNGKMDVIEAIDKVVSFVCENEEGKEKEKENIDGTKTLIENLNVINPQMGLDEYMEE